MKHEALPPKVSSVYCRRRKVGVPDNIASRCLFARGNQLASVGLVSLSIGPGHRGHTCCEPLRQPLRRRPCIRVVCKFTTISDSDHVLLE
jgi:hypothetical protein